MKSLAAELRHPIQIVEYDTRFNTWLARVKTFASIKQLSPKTLKFFEKINFGNMVEASYMLFTIRFTPEIDKSMRIFFKRRYFLIKKIINVEEQDKILEIIAVEIV
ncbi:hypothetical protein phytr_1830 [Candidatus Phycorickettsia trachydisci]|uniref:Phage head-tail adaptor n=1 Tax=Candidatus Phycorickettsia trachydisci TaxID=2115978 RepID=A0A2P1P797_9RICK|nr:head-tail adaptor protein [Candidatus Phycorickettsia trachydisci]AVP87141.1 hypothetical protein phytr_1830 [Candidatus Phycorickettsia trachydisci]